MAEESSEAGTDSFMPPVWRFEREKSLACALALEELDDLGLRPHAPCRRDQGP